MDASLEISITIDGKEFDLTQNGVGKNILSGYLEEIARDIASLKDEISLYKELKNCMKGWNFQLGRPLLPVKANIEIRCKLALVLGEGDERKVLWSKEGEGCIDTSLDNASSNVKTIKLAGCLRLEYKVLKSWAPDIQGLCLKHSQVPEILEQIRKIKIWNLNREIASLEATLAEKKNSLRFLLDNNNESTTASKKRKPEQNK